MSSNTPRLTTNNGFITQTNHPNTSTTATIPIIRSTIDDFREIIREQSFVIPSNSTDVSIKKYPPLPDIQIPSVNNTFFRTETTFTTQKQTQSKRKIFNHFAPAQRGQLPALHKPQNLLMTDAMDLDEDLPQCTNSSLYRAATYTSPGERIISPIKRPSAPSPPTSAQIKRLGQKSFVDGNDDESEAEHQSRLVDEDSQYFNEHFYHYQEPIIMNNRRIDHYNHNNHQTQIIERHPTIVINDGYDHPLDSQDFEP